MQQLPRGPKGEYTPDQIRRSIRYSYHLLTSTLGPEEETEQILDALSHPISQTDGTTEKKK
jgi:hypothetical protein